MGSCVCTRPKLLNAGVAQFPPTSAWTDDKEAEEWPNTRELHPTDYESIAKGRITLEPSEAENGIESEELNEQENESQNEVAQIY